MSKARKLEGLSELLAFASGRTVTRETASADERLRAAGVRTYGTASVNGVEFADGSALIVWTGTGDDRYGASELTPPDPVEVIYYAIDP